MMKIDKLNPYERHETSDATVLMYIWEDLGDMGELGVLNCEYCKKLFNFLDKRFD